MAAHSVRLATTPFEDWPESLTPGEVGTLFRVNPRTVRTWAEEGKLPFFRTAGGHRRFTKSDVWDLYQVVT